MDGVVADFDTAINSVIEFDNYHSDHPDHYDVNSDKIENYVMANPTFFDNLPLMPGAKESINILRKHFEIYFLSTPMWKVPGSFSGKRIWVERNFGAWAEKRLILTHRKDLNNGHFLVDDRLKNGSENFKGFHIHFGQPMFPNWGKVTDFLMLYK